MALMWGTGVSTLVMGVHLSHHARRREYLEAMIRTWEWEHGIPTGPRGILSLRFGPKLPRKATCTLVPDDHYLCRAIYSFPIGHQYDEHELENRADEMSHSERWKNLIDALGAGILILLGGHYDWFRWDELHDDQVDLAIKYIQTSNPKAVEFGFGLGARFWYRAILGEVTEDGEERVVWANEVREIVRMMNENYPCSDWEEFNQEEAT